MGNGVAGLVLAAPKGDANGDSGGGEGAEMPLAAPKGDANDNSGGRGRRYRGGGSSGLRSIKLCY